MRTERRPDQALLIVYPLVNPLNEPDNPTAPRQPVIGFAISFPKSPHAVSVQYRVNEIWSKQEVDELLGSED